jgi:hypothetical protein
MPAGNAPQTVYAPAVPGDWPVVPNNVAEALDELAAEVTVLASVDAPPALHLYVSAINGNDLNDGLTPGTALATLTAAEAKLPQTTGRVVIHVGKGVGATPYAMPSFRKRVLRGELILIGDGAGQAGADGDAITVLLGPTAAGTPDVSQGSFQIAGSGWTLNQYQGKTIEMLTGAAAGDRRTIRNNSTTRIFPSAAFTAAVVNGDTFRIWEPAIFIGVTDVANAAETIFVDGNGSPDLVPSSEVLSAAFYVINFRFITSGAITGNVGFLIKTSAVVFFGVEFNQTQTISMRLDGSSLIMGLNDASDTRSAGVYGMSEFGCLVSTSWLGWGMASIGASAASVQPSVASGNIDGYLVITRGLLIREGAICNFRGGAFISPTAVAALIFTNLGQGFLIAPNSNLPILIEGATAVSGLTVQYGSKAALQNVAFTIPTAGASAITATFNGEIELSTGITGSSGGYGVLSYYGSVVTFTTAWVLTGTFGTGSVDNHSFIDMTLLTTSGDVAIGQGRIVRV